MEYSRETEVEAARGNVSLADGGLIPCDADAEPAIFIESSGGLDHSADHGAQPTADCGGRNGCRKFMAQRDEG